MTTAWLGIGSNLGNRLGFLQAATAALAQLPQTEIIAKSAVYETAPVGGVEQEPFLNGVIKLETTLSPEELLDAVLAIEKQNHRERLIHWGPRTLDIDILAYGNEQVAKSYLQIPHPCIRERAFVLVPWAEVEDSWHIIGWGTVRELLAELPMLDMVGVVKTPYVW